jgi:hypothetical protein
MRLWAGLGLACLVVAGCRHLPDGVVVDVENGTIEAGPCRCKLPQPERPAVPDAPR